MCQVKIASALRILILALVATAQTDMICAQEPERQSAPPVHERIFYGGNFGLQFGTVADIEIAPVVGYWVLPRVAIAIGPDYRFYKYFNEKTHIYGGKAYVELTLLRNINSVIPIGANTDIILHGEDQLLSLESGFFKLTPFDNKRFYLNSVLAGGGLSQWLGKRAAMNILVLYAFTNDTYQLYSTPEIRISFVF
ncbi:MAG TPA: hypothetical protein VK155_13130 [Bacteroidales bacterium]|nr:hypothetical protein [Bacteroidales bacterium]